VITGDSPLTVKITAVYKDNDYLKLGSQPIMPSNFGHVQRWKRQEFATELAIMCGTPFLAD